MATNLQKKALDKMVEKGRAGKKISVSATMREVGYSKNTAVVPQKLTESKGFKDLCDELGLTDSFLTKALYDDIKAKPRMREKELRLAFQVKGKLNTNEQGGQTTNILNIYANEQMERIAGRILNGESKGEGAPDRLLDSDEPTV